MHWKSDAKGMKEVSKVRELKSKKSTLFFFPSVIRLMPILAFTIQSQVRRVEAILVRLIWDKKPLNLYVALPATVLRAPGCKPFEPFLLSLLLYQRTRTLHVQDSLSLLKAGICKKIPYTQCFLFFFFFLILHVKICFFISILPSALSSNFSKQVSCCDRACWKTSFTGIWTQWRLTFTEMFFGQALACRDLSRIHTAVVLGRHSPCCLYRQGEKAGHQILSSLCILPIRPPCSFRAFPQWQGKITQQLTYISLVPPRGNVLCPWQKWEDTDHGTYEPCQECAVGEFPLAKPVKFSIQQTGYIHLQILFTREAKISCT